MTLERGALLNNRYRIVSILGQGGMGSVYRAVDENLGVDVAVKENLFLTDEYARQFRLEASILASLRHPNLPRVGDHFVIEGQGQYLVMDFIEGEDLRERMDRVGPLPEEEVILIGAAICNALNYLHTRKPPVVHRDIKPGNVKITPDGHIILVDFGLAKVMHGGQTTTGARAMTPGYSPPEQYGTARTDPRTDIYSLGATLYAALTGTIPEDGLARATGNAELTPLRRLNPKVSRRMASVIEKSLAVRPDDRYQTAEEFKQALINTSSATRKRTGEQTVTPPPPDALEKSGGKVRSPLPIGLPIDEPPLPPRPITHPRRKGSGCALWLLILILLAGGASAAVYYRPGLAESVLAWLSAPPIFTPTKAFQSTRLQTDQPVLVSSATPQSNATSVSGQETPVPIGTPPKPTETATVNPTATPMGGGTGQLAFASDRTGISQIWLVNTDGSGLQQLTSLDGGACQPNWSPDGREIVFISPCPGKRFEYPGASLHIINADGSNLRNLPSAPEGDFDPSWSFDGKKIAFTSLRDSRPQVYTLNLADNTAVNLSNSPFPDVQPSWSPIGMQIAFVRYRTAAQIWLMTDKGTLQAQFSRSGDYNDNSPAWTPDGQIILYTQTTKTGTVPWLMGMRYEDRVNPYKEFRIPAESVSGLGPIASVSVSPDGHWVAFESWPDGTNHDIYIMTITGTNLTRVTTDPGFDFDPAWRPLQKP